MSYDQFIESLKGNQPPALTPVLVSLWFDAKNDWHGAHEKIQDLETREGALIHAYLHRKEGDLGNASYWYNRAHEKMPDISLEAEWDELVKRFTKN